jgi:bone morphogenetic protein 7
MTTLLFLCLLLLSPRTLASLSGLYIDNGVDQTVMEHSMSALEKKEVEHEILNLLGLQERPRLKRKTLDPKVALGRSAPNFLLDVYKSLAENPSSRTTRSEFNLSEKDLNAIHQSDAIITFASHSQFFLSSHSWLAKLTAGVLSSLN